MPIYAYRCEACGHAKDVLQKVSDPLLTRCPACGAEAFQKQLTAAGFQLKGSGWYVTDFKGDNSAKSAAAKSAAAKADAAQGESGSSESKASEAGDAKGAGSKSAETPSVAPAPGATQTANKPADKAATPAASSGTSTGSGPASGQ